MKYDRFEDLPVWKSAIDLAVGIYTLTKNRAFHGPGDLCSQLRRAALSVSNNIAEGFERGTTAELLMFLYIARGSAGEDRSMLNFVDRLLEERRPKSSDQISNLKSQISDLKSLAESCSRQIRAWADKLQDTDIKGQRHLTQRAQEVYRFSTPRRSVLEATRGHHEVGGLLGSGIAHEDSGVGISPVCISTTKRLGCAGGRRMDSHLR